MINGIIKIVLGLVIGLIVADLIDSKYSNKMIEFYSMVTTVEEPKIRETLDSVTNPIRDFLSESKEVIK